jgi:hypothetical protein
MTNEQLAIFLKNDRNGSATLAKLLAYEDELNEDDRPFSINTKDTAQTSTLFNPAWAKTITITGIIGGIHPKTTSARNEAEASAKALIDLEPRLKAKINMFTMSISGQQNKQRNTNKGAISSSTHCTAYFVIAASPDSADFATIAEAIVGTQRPHDPTKPQGPQDMPFKNLYRASTLAQDWINCDNGCIGDCACVFAVVVQTTPDKNIEDFTTSLHASQPQHLTLRTRFTHSKHAVVLLDSEHQDEALEESRR